MLTTQFTASVITICEQTPTTQVATQPMRADAEDAGYDATVIAILSAATPHVKKCMRNSAAKSPPFFCPTKQHSIMAVRAPPDTCAHAAAHPNTHTNTPTDKQTHTARLH